MTTAAIILPTFQESETIADVIQSLQVTIPYQHTIIVVDDSPDDATARAVEQAFGDDDTVVYLRRPNGSGLASAVITGFDHALTTRAPDVLLCMDADGQHPADAAFDLLEAVRAGADIAVGTRFADGGGIDGEWPLDRLLLSRGAALAARWTIPTARGVSDPMSGLFGVDRELVDGRLEWLEPDGFKILLEVLARCPVDEVAEVGYRFRERRGGESTLDGRELVRFGRHLLRASVPSRAPQQPVATDGGNES